MNRRDFIQFTVFLAAAGRAARFAGIAWVPTQPEVDIWLDYYKTYTSKSTQALLEDLAKAFNDFGEAGESPRFTYRGGTTFAEVDRFEQFEALWERQHADRSAVARAQGTGYFAGRDGQPRLCSEYTRPSNEAFAWYNGWATGEKDLRWREARAREAASARRMKARYS